MSSSETGSRTSPIRATGFALAGGVALAMMETASIMSQPGAGIPSRVELAILITWLALPYTVLLGTIGLAVGLILARIFGFESAFVSAAAACGALLWLRPLTRLGDQTVSVLALELLLVLVAALAGAAVGRIVRRPDGAHWVAAGTLALALMVIMSRSVPGRFGHPTAPSYILLRLAACAAMSMLVFFGPALPRAMLSRSARIVSWLRWPALALSGFWVLFALHDFTTLLSRHPSAPAVDVEAATAASGRPNILLISIDTLRADHLSCYGYGKPTSPAIDRLAAEGVLFTQASSTASFTLPAHASMMTGLFPSSHGATYQNRDPHSFTVRGMGTGYPTLAELLRDHGYDTAAFVSGPLMSRQFGFSRGFNSYDDRYDRLQSAQARLFSRSLLFTAMERAGIFSGRDRDSQRTAGEVNPLVREWLRARGRGGRPFFLFVHYWDPHGPYDPPAPWGRRADGSRISVKYDMDRLLTGAYTLTPAALADTLALYDGEVSYVDQHVGGLLDALREDHSLDDSLVILTADHGESFGEHAHWEHSRVLYEDLLHVPFIVRLPGGRAAGSLLKSIIAQPTDILPTALAVAGLPIPEGIEGRDLSKWIGSARLPEPAQSGVKAPGLAFAELDRNVDWPVRWGARFDRDLTSVRTLRWKYIRASTGQEELYDLQRDPAERTSRVGAEPETAATLRALTDAWRRSLRGPSGEKGTEEIDEGLRDNLRSLGYIQ